MPLLGYVPKNDEKNNSVPKGLKNPTQEERAALQSLVALNEFIGPKGVPVLGPQPPLSPVAIPVLGVFKDWHQILADFLRPFPKVNSLR